MHQSKKESTKPVFLGFFGLLFLAMVYFLGSGSTTPAASPGAPQKPARKSEPVPPAVTSISPWGYNAERNTKRWKVIYKSIAGDMEKHNGKFVLSDYGADQGFFSISTAKAFPLSTVVPVELGGTGGALWDKQVDALAIMQKRAKDHGVKNTQLLICKQRFTSQTFRDLVESNSIVDYQLILSVIHWFEMTNREEFEAAMVTILRAAKTTIIEFPYVGPNEKEMLGQVGFANVEKWLDGRRDVELMLTDSIASKAANPSGYRFNVKKIATLPWFALERHIYRVDFLGAKEDNEFNCVTALQSLRCNRSLVSVGECRSTF